MTDPFTFQTIVCSSSAMFDTISGIASPALIRFFESSMTGYSEVRGFVSNVNATGEVVSSPIAFTVPSYSVSGRSPWR